MLLPRDHTAENPCIGTEWWCNQFGYPNHWTVSTLRSIAIKVEDPAWQLTRGYDSGVVNQTPSRSRKCGWGMVLFFLFIIIFIQYLIRHDIIS